MLGLRWGTWHLPCVMQDHQHMDSLVWVLVPPTGIELSSPCIARWILSRWTTREVFLQVSLWAKTAVSGEGEKRPSVSSWVRGMFSAGVECENESEMSSWHQPLSCTIEETLGIRTGIGREESPVLKKRSEQTRKQSVPGVRCLTLIRTRHPYKDATEEQ